MHVLVSGGTGFIGRPLVRHLLGNSHEVTVVSRSPNKVFESFGGKASGCTIDDLPAAFDGVANLAGASLDKRWTDSYKRKITDSRVNTTERLRDAAEKAGARVFVSTSAVNYYPPGADPVDETSAPGDNFLSEVCKKWEQAAQSDKYRVVIPRVGMVLHRSGGALAVMLPIFKWFLGGRLGSGRQYWSWIHLHDVVRLYTWALENEGVEGAVNASSPQAVTNREFTRTLAKAVGRPVSLPVPRFALRVLYGEMADMLLEGPNVQPKRTLELGFTFEHPELAGALENAVHNEP